MPAELYDQNYRFIARQALLNSDEITRLAKLFVRGGVREIRLTGGEPLLRRGPPPTGSTIHGSTIHGSTIHGSTVQATLSRQHRPRRNERLQPPSTER